jgi:hypothetical protein
VIDAKNRVFPHNRREADIPVREIAAHQEIERLAFIVKRAPQLELAARN